MAVPTIVKIPEPMTAPMPREVRLSQPKDFFNRNSAPSQSEISWSMFLRRKRDEATQALRSNPARASDGNGMGNEMREECTARGGADATKRKEGAYIRTEYKRYRGARQKSGVKSPHSKGARLLDEIGTGGGGRHKRREPGYSPGRQKKRAKPGMAGPPKRE